MSAGASSPPRMRAGSLCTVSRSSRCSSASSESAGSTAWVLAACSHELNHVARDREALARRVRPHHLPVLVRHRERELFRARLPPAFASHRPPLFERIATASKRFTPSNPGNGARNAPRNFPASRTAPISSRAARLPEEPADGACRRRHARDRAPGARPSSPPGAPRAGSLPAPRASNARFAASSADGGRPQARSRRLAFARTGNRLPAVRRPRVRQPLE